MRGIGWLVRYDPFKRLKWELGPGDGRCDVMTMRDPMALPIGRYYTSKPVDCREARGPEDPRGSGTIINLHPGDRLDIVRRPGKS